MRTYSAIIDSDVFVAWLLEHDANHQKAASLLTKAEEQQTPLVTTNMVIAETATVLSHRSGQPLARTFLNAMQKFPSIFISEDLFQETVTIFRTVENKNTSMVDCSNVVVAQRFAIPQVLSFDEFYRKKFSLKTAA